MSKVRYQENTKKDKNLEPKNLSEKIGNFDAEKVDNNLLWTEDVREFIKRREEDLSNIRFGKMTSSQALKRLKKEAGKTLSGDL